MSGWKPIETAPSKSGTYLVWHKDYYRGHPEISDYHLDRWDVGSSKQPTHWMPLPENPQLLEIDKNISDWFYSVEYAKIFTQGHEDFWKDITADIGDIKNPYQEGTKEYDAYEGGYLAYWGAIKPYNNYPEDK